MPETEFLAEQFERNRTRLRTVAFRMLGSLNEADDAVQEAWIRLSRTDSNAIENLGGWLTTVVARVCLDMLRSRKLRGEVSLDLHVPEPILGREDRVDPEHEVLLADSVGLALLIVLDTLSPAERLAFVLHDMFAMSFDEIAAIMGRSTTAARQLASRGRRRVQGASATPDSDLSRQRAVVDAFIAAARTGNVDELLAILDPDVVVRADTGTAAATGAGVVRGAEIVAKRAALFGRGALTAQPVLVNGAAGILSRGPDGRVFSVMGFTVKNGKIVQINVLADPERLRRLDVSALDE